MERRRNYKSDDEYDEESDSNEHSDEEYVPGKNNNGRFDCQRISGKKTTCASRRNSTLR